MKWFRVFDTEEYGEVVGMLHEIRDHAYIRLYLRGAYGLNPLEVMWVGVGRTYIDPFTSPENAMEWLNETTPEKVSAIITEELD